MPKFRAGTFDASTLDSGRGADQDALSEHEDAADDNAAADPFQEMQQEPAADEDNPAIDADTELMQQHLHLFDAAGADDDYCSPYTAVALQGVPDLLYASG